MKADEIRALRWTEKTGTQLTGKYGPETEQLLRAFFVVLREGVAQLAEANAARAAAAIEDPVRMCPTCKKAMQRKPGTDNLICGGPFGCGLELQPSGQGLYQSVRR